MPMVYTVHRDQLRVVRKALKLSYEKLRDVVPPTAAPSQDFIEVCEALAVIQDVEESGSTPHAQDRRR